MNHKTAKKWNFIKNNIFQELWLQLESVIKTWMIIKLLKIFQKIKFNEKLTFFRNWDITLHQPIQCMKKGAQNIKKNENLSKIIFFRNRDNNSNQSRNPGSSLCSIVRPFLWMWQSKQFGLIFSVLSFQTDINMNFGF
jgi:hypothetical protein